MTERVADRRAIIGGGALLASAGALALPARARAADAAGHWQPATETQDDWMDKPGTRHRLMFDTTAPAAVARSADRRVGKECVRSVDSGWRRIIRKKQQLRIHLE